MKDGNEIKKQSGMWLNHEARMDKIEAEMKHDQGEQARIHGRIQDVWNYLKRKEEETAAMLRAKRIYDLLYLVCFGLASIAFALNIYAQVLALKIFN